MIKTGRMRGLERYTSQDLS